MILLQHISNIGAGLLKRFSKERDRALLRLQKIGDKRKQRGFTNGSITETLDGQIVLHAKVVKGFEFFDTYDMSRVCDRIRMELNMCQMSKEKVAKEIGVSRDVLYDYVKPVYLEKSMQPQILIKLAEYFGKDKYYFCNDYHRFLDEVDGKAYLKGKRTEHNMSQRQFAKTLEISLPRYKAYESGKNKIPMELWKMLQETGD